MADSVFSENIFPCFDEKDLAKPSMDGLADPTLNDFLLLDFSALCKPEFKNDQFEKEFIRSFLVAAQAETERGYADTVRPAGYLFLDRSYAIPALYLVRHCMELSLKRAIRVKGGDLKSVHGLDRLWSALLQRIPKCERSGNSKVVSRMGRFVKFVSSFDSTGVDLRYPKAKDGSFTQDRAMWVNMREIVKLLEKFVEQLELLN